MKKKSIKSTVLMGVAATVMVAGLATPALADEKVQEEQDHLDTGPPPNSSPPFVCIKAPCGEDNEDSATHDPANPPFVCIKAPCGDDYEDSATHDPVNPPFVCIKAPCGSSSPGEEEDRVKDPGIRQCDLTPPGCENTTDPVTDPDQNPLKDAGKDNKGIFVDPAGDANDNAGASKTGNISTAIAPDGDRQITNSPTTYGCPFNYNYDVEYDWCFPSDEDLNFFPVILGEPPWPDSAGGYVGMLGGVAGDSLQILGSSIQEGLGGLGDVLVDFGDGGGPIGWGIQGLGYTLGVAGDLAGGILETAGQAVNAVSDGVGEVIDGIGSAAEDAWDTVSDWF